MTGLEAMTMCREFLDAEPDLRHVCVIVEGLAFPTIFVPGASARLDLAEYARHSPAERRSRFVRPLAAALVARMRPDGARAVLLPGQSGAVLELGGGA